MMLVLSRKPGDTIVIGNDVILVVLKLRDGCVAIGIQAPDSLRVLRGEIASPGTFLRWPPVARFAFQLGYILDRETRERVFNWRFSELVQDLLENREACRWRGSRFYLGACFLGHVVWTLAGCIATSETVQAWVRLLRPSK